MKFKVKTPKPKPLPKPVYQFTLTQDELVHLNNILDLLIENGGSIQASFAPNAVYDANDDGQAFIEKMHTFTSEYDDQPDHSSTFNRKEN